MKSPSVFEGLLWRPGRATREKCANLEKGGTVDLKFLAESRAADSGNGAPSAKIWQARARLGLDRSFELDHGGLRVDH